MPKRLNKRMTANVTQAMTSHKQALFDKTDPSKTPAYMYLLSNT